MDDGNVVSWMVGTIGIDNVTLDEVGRRLSNDYDYDSSPSMLSTLGTFLIFIIVIYLLCHTADNYFSPVLAAICDLLDMPPEVAGVTFLAFGNGAPDVFSSIAALTSTSNIEASLLVGMGSLLGAAMFTVTLVVGGVLHVQNTDVPPLPFSRDVIFLAASLLLIIWSAVIGEVSLSVALSYLALYAFYVGFVFVGPGGQGSNRPSAGHEGQACADMRFCDLPSGSRVLDDGMLSARWIPAGEGEARDKRPDLLSPEVLGRQSLIEPRAKDDYLLRSTSGGGRVAAAGGGGGKGAHQAGTDAGEDPVGAGLQMNHDYFPPPPPARLRDEDSSDEGDSLLGRGGGHDRTGEEASLRGDVYSMVPGSTVSMFLEEDDSAASWLAQRRWGGKIWGRAAPSRLRSGEYEETMSLPLLQDEQSTTKSIRGVGFGGSSDPWASTGRQPLFSRRFEDAWASIQWRQWRLRRRLRRQLMSSDISEMPWYQRVFRVLELPFVLARNATIPPVEAASWSQLQATVSTALSPLLCVWAFGLGNSGFFESAVPWWVVAVLVGIPVGAVVWWTTHRRKMPQGRSYRLSLALVAFISCVAWIYFLADLAVELIEDVGSATGISSSVLGLTLLAWGNSCGDLVTNVAVSRAGYPGMAIAGSYGGPLFNLLLGIGIPMVYTTIVHYPSPCTFKLDAPTIVTAVATLVVTLGTLPAVSLAGYRFPERAPLALLGVYSLYIVVALLVMLI